MFQISSRSDRNNMLAPYPILLEYLSIDSMLRIIQAAHFPFEERQIFSCKNFHLNYLLEVLMNTLLENINCQIP